MLRRFGHNLLAGKFQAIIYTSLFSVLGLVIPLLSYILGGVVPALVTLRKGSSTGLQVIFGSGLLILLLAMIMGISPYIVLAFTIGIWLPVWLCATTLRLTESQAALLQVAALVSLFYIIFTHYFMGDVVAWWRQWLELWLTQVPDTSKRAGMEDILTAAAPLMNALTAVGLFVSMVLTVFVARWWQSHLFNKGGFRQEFHALSLPRALVFLVTADLLVILVSGAEKGSIGMDIMLLLMFVYLFQGIAAAHRVVLQKKMSRSWLTGMYLFMFLLPQTILFMACMGMVDSWLLRKQTTNMNDNY